MARTRRSQMPVESSWRMVEEGENDSFDTTLIRDSFEDDFILSSQQSQLTSSSSQEQASQDSIRDFAENADEDQVILRAPFQPSIYSTRHASVDKERTPIPEFFMPTIGASSPQRASARSSRTVRPVAYAPPKVRRRAPRRDSIDETRFDYSVSTENDRVQNHTPSISTHGSNFFGRLVSLVYAFLFECLAWILSVVGMVLRLLKWPVAIFLAFYMAIGITNVGKDMIAQSASASLQPICQIPGVSFFNPTWCPERPPASSSKGIAPRAQRLEFDELMKAQSQLEEVLETSAEGVSLPLEMTRSETSVRDLAIMVRYSDLPGREELVYEFGGYLNTSRKIINDLQLFNTHIGSAVDSVIGMNRWTSRHIDSVAAKQEAQNSALARGIRWILAPFQPVAFDEYGILNQYVEHSTFVLHKIENLIQEAQALLRLLEHAENHLQQIHEYIVRDDYAVRKERGDVLSELWTYLGLNHHSLRKMEARLLLLRQIDGQRKSAIARLKSLVHDLGDIQTKVTDLRDRIAAPGLVPDITSIPLSVHIETINAGIARLEAARSRIRTEEDERINETLARGDTGVPMIES
ncbi:hypothetical protein F5Y10DRAFT_247368 [Nemania abortiva]|nr:hypothetical protein F5Y10DRAFT_247368 [Nemania abortiva]